MVDGAGDRETIARILLGPGARGPCAQFMLGVGSGGLICLVRVGFACSAARRGGEGGGSGYAVVCRDRRFSVSEHARRQHVLFMIQVPGERAWARRASLRWARMSRRIAASAVSSGAIKVQLEAGEKMKRSGDPILTSGLD